MTIILLSCNLGSFGQEAGSGSKKMSAFFSVNLSVELKSGRMSALLGALRENGTDEGGSENLE